MEALVPPNALSADRSFPASRYASLALLLVIAGGYQAFLAHDVFHSILHPESVYNLPFIVDPTSGTIEGADAPLEGGLRKGDHLLSVDGLAYTGTHVIDEAFATYHPTGTLTVTVRDPKATTARAGRTISIPLTTWRGTGQNRPALIATRLILYVLMPCFAVALGFWVASMRPRDSLAWILLGVMLGFSQLLGPSTGAWGRGIRDVARAYHLLAGNFWPIGMLLFGLYFPEPFRLENRAWWKALKWALILVMVAFALPDVIVKTVDVERYSAVESVGRYSSRLDAANMLLATLAVTIFFAAVFTKGSMAVSADAKRRLRLLYFGSAIGLAPVFTALFVGLIKGTSDIGSFLPQWLLFTILLLLFVFPLTLAYTIVVQRALDVHVVIRQGLQYALARSGVRVIGIALTVALVWTTVYLVQNSDTRSPLFYAIIAAAIVAGFGFRRFGDWLRAWTDRHFFRDAYNAEQILSELSDNVRTIRDTESLLETISRSIAESLHVPRVAALMDGSGPYRAAYALGYSELPQIVFPEGAATVRQLTEIREPTRVYLDDPNSWVYRRPGMSEEERRKLQQLGSELLLPLSTRERLLGFVSLSQKRSEAPYSSGDLRLLKSVSIQTGLALENASLAATVAHEVAEREKLGRELEIAREVQQRLFPQKLPQIAGLDYFGACRPALGVGGDYYDFLALPDGRLGIALGDVSGKGIAAALMMASLQASLRAEAMRASDNLAHIICAVNRLLFDASTSNRYATFFYAQYDPAERTLSYVNAGHNAPMLFRKSGDEYQVMRLEVGGTVVGLIEFFPFVQDSITLKPGDLLVLYTDGISEAMDRNNEEWGEERMMQAIRTCQSQPAEQMIENLMTAADAFASGAPQHDDMTMVVMRMISH
jgi:sigma-B regulation protein RsbU (phosphoserine phosphatase)